VRDLIYDVRLCARVTMLQYASTKQVTSPIRFETINLSEL